MNDTNYTFQTGGNIVTPFHHCSLTADSKGFYKISLTMSDTTSAIYWRAYYQLLQGNWTEINSTDKFKTSPVTTAYLPVETTTSNKPQSTMIRFRFEPVTNDTTKTPKLINYDVRALWFPPIKNIITCEAIVRNPPILRDGGIDDDNNQRFSNVRSALYAWLNPATAWPRAFYPLHWSSASDTVYAKLLPTDGDAFCEPIYIGEDGTAEYLFRLTIQIVEGVSF
jgi:hypothetical protein